MPECLKRKGRRPSSFPVVRDAEAKKRRSGSQGRADKWMGFKRVQPPGNARFSSTEKGGSFVALSNCIPTLVARRA